MNTTLKNAYTEVNQIIELLGNEYKSQIPQKILNLFKEKQNTNYKTNINKDTPIDKMEISRTALVIISILNLKYWERDEDKKSELKRTYNENERKFQEKINVYKQNDWLKTKKDQIIQKEDNQEKALIEQKNISWISKIRNFFKDLIHLDGKREK